MMQVDHGLQLKVPHTSYSRIVYLDTNKIVVIISKKIQKTVPGHRNEKIREWE